MEMANNGGSGGGAGQGRSITWNCQVTTADTPSTTPSQGKDGGLGR